MPLKCFLVAGDDPDFHEKIKEPGAMWLCPWYYDPKEEDNHREFGQTGFLSIHYWNDHGKTRPPVSVRCPNGSTWVPDQISSNGTGWTVTGEAPAITCTPSIDVKGYGDRPGYHGFLRDGIFTDDLEGRTY